MLLLLKNDTFEPPPPPQTPSPAPPLRAWSSEPPQFSHRLSALAVIMCAVRKIQVILLTLIVVPRSVRLSDAGHIRHSGRVEGRLGGKLRRVHLRGTRGVPGPLDVVKISEEIADIDPDVFVELIRRDMV